jgi:predicted short-subunit dehydrogenase-like oxidoreductase (DUF2520 family)
MSHTLQTPRRAVATAAIVGRGRLGRVLARALAAAGVQVTGPSGRDAPVEAADVVLLCVPDADIARVAAALRREGGWVGHMSGATGLTDADVDFGLHPLQTFVGDEGPEVFSGIGCAVDGRTPAALEVAEELAIRLGAHPFRIDDDRRAGYHAAASIASNFTVTLLAAAERMAGTAGLDPAEARAVLSPLVRATVENWAAHGPDTALTGPVARGDAATVARQREAIAAQAPELLDLFDVLSRYTRELAHRDGAGR